MGLILAFEASDERRAWDGRTGHGPGPSLCVLAITNKEEVRPFGSNSFDASCNE